MDLIERQSVVGLAVSWYAARLFSFQCSVGCLVSCHHITSLCGPVFPMLLCSD